MSIFAGRSRLVLAAAGIVLAAVYARQASGLRMPAFSDPMGPRAVPYLIAGGLALSCLALVAEHFAKAERLAVPVGPTATAAITVALLAAYFWVIEPLGFVPATALFLLGFLSVTNRGRPATNVAVAILFPVATHLVLVMLLGARLPPGILAGG
ncbi:MAG: tripartite tricarboxylate transporter TctB family protein [Rhodospirillales bacterium]|jgi:putative tricarboxylic transport membrane protein